MEQIASAKRTNLKVVPMTREYAQDISTWKYQGEYAVYSFEPNEETLAELLDGSYYACLDEEDTLMGYFCYGVSARIPLSDAEKTAYKQPCLDFGLGMRPRLCGKGKGADFMQTGLAFAQKQFAPKSFRLTVAAFNHRAVHLYEKLHFTRTAAVSHLRFGAPFYVLTRNL